MWAFVRKLLSFIPCLLGRPSEADKSAWIALHCVESGLVVPQDNRKTLAAGSVSDVTARNILKYEKPAATSSSLCYSSQPGLRPGSEPGRCHLFLPVWCIEAEGGPEADAHLALAKHMHAHLQQQIGTQAA